jgi:hypothetical protein
MNTLAVGQKVSHWRVLVVDRHHATCMCRCGTVRILNTEELINGAVALSCGCMPVAAQELQQIKQAEDFVRCQREHKQAWKPDR